MDSEIIKLIDTAIKIGLGATIAAVSSYGVTRYKHRSEESRENNKRFFDSIERISSSAEEYFQKWAGYTSIITGASKGTTEKDSPVGDGWWKVIGDRDNALTKSRDDKMTAISQLKLLGLNDVSVILEETTKIEKELREIVMFNKTIPSLKELREFENRMHEQREIFYTTLSTHYNE